jgi:hypothetical protein
MNNLILANLLCLNKAEIHMKYPVLIFLMSIIFYSCALVENQDTGCMCTAVFVSIGVTVVDQNNKVVDSLTVTVKNKITGKVYDFYGETREYGGGYLVMTDEYTKEFSMFPQTIVFTGKKGNTKVSADFLIVTDECKCHIGKTAGPDTLRMSL